VVADRLRNDKDPGVARECVQLITSTRFKGYEPLLALATEHERPEARRPALTMIGRKDIPALLPEEQTVPILLRATQSDKDREAREDAMRGLSERRDRRLLPILKALLASDDRADKWIGYRFLTYSAWKGDAEVLSILEARRADPVVGEQVTRHLKSQGDESTG
jgi:HEAT repeat protein